MWHQRHRKKIWATYWENRNSNNRLVILKVQPMDHQQEHYRKSCRNEHLRALPPRSTEVDTLGCSIATCNFMSLLANSGACEGLGTTDQDSESSSGVWTSYFLFGFAMPASSSQVFGNTTIFKKKDMWWSGDMHIKITSGFGFGSACFHGLRTHTHTHTNFKMFFLTECLVAGKFLSCKANICCRFGVFCAKRRCIKTHVLWEHKVSSISHQNN